MRDGTLCRHARVTRALHLVNAVVVIVLLVTGLALGDVLPEASAAWLGGHVRINATHQVLGVAFAAALVALVVVLPRGVRRLLRDASHFRRTDWLWPARFLAFMLAPRGRGAPFHDGRFDPAQRAVFVGIILSVFVVSASGVYLYVWTPAFPLGQLSLAYAIRLHIAAAWLLIACLCLHIVAGIGLPWTHRGLAAAMFGNGRVSASLAQTLWPRWAAHAAAEREAATGRRERGG